MLKRFLHTKQDLLSEMLSTKQQLQKQSELEQYRLTMLQQHMDGLNVAQGPSSGMALSNASNLKLIMQHMHLQQQGESERALHALQQQQQACHQQAAFNMGIEQLIQRKTVQQQLIEKRQQQKQEDEIAGQFFALK